MMWHGLSPRSSGWGARQDARFLVWLSRWGDGFSGVFTGIVTRAAAKGKVPDGLR